MNTIDFTNQQDQEQEEVNQENSRVEAEQDHDFDMNMERVEGEDLTMTVDDECNMENEALGFEGCFQQEATNE